MKLAKIIFKNPNNHGETEIYRIISRSEPENGKIYVLKQNEPGVMGKDGSPISLSEVAGIYMQYEDGTYSNENLVTQLEKWARTNGPLVE